MRPPLALERLTERSHGQLVFELPHPRTDGATPWLRDPLELIEKVAILIPPPRFHTLRFHGLLAPHAGWRSLIVPRPAEDAGQAGRGPEAGESARPSTGSARPAPEPGRLSWAALLRRVFAIDVLACPRGGGRLRVIAAVEDPVTVRQILAARRPAETLGPGPPAPPGAPAIAP